MTETNELVAVPAAAVSEVEKKTAEAVARAESFIIKDGETFGAAGAELVAIKALEKEVDKTFEPIVAAALAAHREALAAKAKHRAPLEAAEAVYKRKMGAFEEAERKRVAEENRRAQEAREAEAAARRQKEEEEAAERERQAAELEAAGLAETAAALRAAPAPAQEPEPEPEPAPLAQAPTAAGVSFRYNYSAEVTDLLELVKAVASGAAPTTLLLPNQTALNQMAKALKEELRLPGVALKKDKTVSARG